MHDTDYFDAGETQCLDIAWALGDVVDEGDEIEINVMIGTLGTVPTHVTYQKDGGKANFTCKLDGTRTGTVVCEPDEKAIEASDLADLISKIITA